MRTFPLTFTGARRPVAFACSAAAMLVALALNPTHARAQSPVTQQPVISGQQIGGPAGSPLDIGVSLGNDGAVVFRARSRPGAPVPFQRVGSVTPSAAGSIGVYQDASIPAGTTALGVRRGQLATYFQTGDIPSQDDAIIAFDPYQSAAVGGVRLTVRGDSFGMRGIDSVLPGSSPTSVFVFGDTSPQGLPARTSVGLYEVSTVGGTHITIFGDLFARGIVPSRPPAQPTTPRDMDADDDGLGERIMFSGQTVASDGALSDAIFAVSTASSSRGVVLTVRGANFSVQHEPVTGPSVDRNVYAYGGSATATGARLIATGRFADGSTSDMPAARRTLELPSSIPGALGGVAVSQIGLAFSTLDPAGQELGIFSSSFDGQMLPVILVGDALGGSIVSRLEFDPQGLNSLGQLAFYAELSDGSSGFFLASNVPAPAAASVLGLGAFIASRRRRRSV